MSCPDLCCWPQAEQRLSSCRVGCHWQACSPPPPLVTHKRHQPDREMERTPPDALIFLGTTKDKTAQRHVYGRLDGTLRPDVRRGKEARHVEEDSMTERISLEGKVAVVTGAGRGLGRAYVELLAERGPRV